VPTISTLKLCWISFFSVKGGMLSVKEDQLLRYRAARDLIGVNQSCDNTQAASPHPLCLSDAVKEKMPIVSGANLAQGGGKSITMSLVYQEARLPSTISKKCFEISDDIVEITEGAGNILLMGKLQVGYTLSLKSLAKRCNL